jgi:hypothetical protein
VAFLILAAMTVVSGFRLALLSFRSRRNFVQLTFWVFVYCWLGLAGSAQIKSNHLPWYDESLKPKETLSVVLTILVGLATYQAGIYYQLHRRESRSDTRSRLTIPDTQRFVILTLVSVVTSFASIQYQGGLQIAFQTRAEVAQRSSKAEKMESLLETNLQHAPPMAALIVTVYLLLAEAPLISRPLLKVAVSILVGYNLIANYPPSLPRVAFGQDILSIALLVVCKRPRIKPFVMVALVLSLVYLFPYLDYFRSSEGYGQSDIESPSVQLTRKEDYDAFQMISNTQRVTETAGFDYGYHIVGSFLFFVPRSIWHAKPFGTGQSVGELLQYRNTNLSSPLWAELYFAGGLVAVAAGFFLYGRLTTNIERVGNASGLSPMAVYLSFAAGYQIFLLRGELLSGIAYAVPSLLIFSAYLTRGPKLGNAKPSREPFKAHRISNGKALNYV